MLKIKDNIDLKESEKFRVYIKYQRAIRKTKYFNI